MKLLVIGMHRYVPKLRCNELNVKTWRSLSPFFDEIHVIALSSDCKHHSDRENNIFFHLAPNFKLKPMNLIIFYLYSFFVGLRIIRRINVVVDASEPIGGGVISLIFKLLMGVKVVVELQGELFRRDVYGPLTPLVSRFVALRADVVRAVSWKLEKDAISVGIPKEKIAYVPPRVDVTQFNSSMDEKQAKHSIGLSDEDQVILFIGSLVPVKGIPYLIQAFSLVVREVPYAKLYIIGDGPSKCELLRIVEKLGISKSVLFQGYVHHSKLPVFLSSSTMLVLPSISEGMARVILEAMACGKPVVASNVGGIRELVNHGENGLLVQPGDITQLAGSIVMLLKEHEFARNLGRAGRKLVEKNFSHEKGIKRMLDMYKRLAHF